MTEVYVEDFLVKRFLELEDENPGLLTIVDDDGNVLDDSGKTVQKDADGKFILDADGYYLNVDDEQLQMRQVFRRVNFENDAFDVTAVTDKYYFEIFFLRNMPTQKELGTTGRNRWLAIMQVNVCVPKGDGKSPIDDRFELLFKKFHRGYITDGLEILGVGRSSARSDEDFYSVPVSINWRADLDNK